MSGLNGEETAVLTPPGTPLRTRSRIAPPVPPSAHRGVASIVAAVLVAVGLTMGGGDSHRTALQRDFAAAAAEFHVPQRVLMAVAYQETQWETHGGRPSVTGNYNVMGLTQVTPAAFRTAAGPETADGRGAEPAARRGVPARELNALRAALSPARQAASPALHTLDRAAALIHADPAALRTDPRQSIRGAAALL